MDRILASLVLLVVVSTTMAQMTLRCDRAPGASCLRASSSCPPGTAMTLSSTRYSDCMDRSYKCCIPTTPSRCNTMMRGECVSHSTACPSGMSPNAMASNYIYCNSVNAKCCTRGGTGPQPPTPGPFQPRTTQAPKTPNPYGSTCGLGSFRPGDRVLNGIDTGPCDWPFVVSLRSSIKKVTNGQLNYANTVHACGGVLIDWQWVMTSAFCIVSAGDSTANARNRLVVVAGDYNISKIDIYPNDGLQQEQIFNVRQAIIHPSYKYTHTSQVEFEDPIGTNSNNLALIKLDRPVRPDRCAGAACLPLLQDVNNDRLFYDDCVVLGWGFVKGGGSTPSQGELDLLKMSSVQLSSPKACDYLTRKLGKQNDRFEGSICQAPKHGVSDNCLGDEGGPVLCNTGKNWVIRGILPFNMCFEDSFSLYVTEVVKYLSWIKDTMKRFQFS